MQQIIDKSTFLKKYCLKNVGLLYLVVFVIYNPKFTALLLTTGTFGMVNMIVGI